MGRSSKERNKAYELYKNGLMLIEIANKLNIPVGTIRSWKNRYKWDSENATLQIKKCNVAKEVKQVIDNKELNDNQKLFCLYYTKYFNASKAYKRVYNCSEMTARVNSSKLMAKKYIKDEILRLKQNKLNRSMLDASDIFQKYMDIAFADITDFLTFGREMVPVMGPFGPIEVKGKKLKKEINVVKFKESNEIDGSLISEVKQGKDGASIKLSDRMKAMQWLSDHMDIATEEQKLRIEKMKVEIAKVKSDEGDKNIRVTIVDNLRGEKDED